MKVHSIFFLLTSLLFLSGCDMFKIDNYDAPNASLKGGIKDAETGALVETDIQNGSAIRVYELGWPEGVQTWVVKQNGEFQNDMVFAAHYKVVFMDCNFYPFTIEDLDIKKGSNTYDFEVVPYIRARDVSITRQGDQVVATFKLQAGKPEVKLGAVRLFAFSDMYVGEQVKYNISDPSCYKTFSPAETIDANTTYTLSIDIPSNTNEFFKYKKNYYFRIGALASVSDVGTIRYNYAPLVVISL
ncbi:MAG: DUF3823 domain-containing protein [Tannerellaceae bacterium]|nr:DUF3823 domain-containing protein [Tannerellaceae bacterium]